MNSYHFTFIRHGESIGNRDDLVQGQHDFPLSPAGRAQIERLAERWQADDRTFDAIIASPLERAKESAEILKAALFAPILIEPLWMERHRGKAQGLTKEQAARYEPDQGPNSLFNAYGQTGESDWQLSIRAGRALQSLFVNPPGRYLVISHGGLLNKLLHLIFGLKLGYGFYFHIPNAGTCEVEYELEDHRWIMRSLGSEERRVQPYSAPEEDYRFVFLRHAESEGNRQRLFQGHFETELTERGHVQAEQAGQILKQAGYRFEAVIASPQIRAQQTAQAIAAQFDLPVENDERFKEIDNGQMAGLNGEQIDARFPVRSDRQNPYEPIGHNGESWFELFLRAGEAVEALVARPPGEYLIVSHGAFLNSLLYSIMGMIPQPSSRPGLFYFGNTAYVDLAYHQALDRWSLLTFNHGVLHED